jgi:hypothetical protein
MNSAEETSTALGTALDALIRRHYTPTSHRFDYGAAAVSGEYQALKQVTARLSEVDPGRLTKVESACAFWLNAYTALVVESVIDRSIATSIRERDDFFDAPYYCIGSHHCSLDVIEHGILRCNARKYLGIGPLLARNDPRLAWRLRTPDPRIHFGLYTATVSSPAPIAFTSRNLDAQLEKASRDYLQATVQIIEDENVIRLPAVFRWYISDFGRSLDDVIAFVNARVDNARLRAVREDHGHRTTFAPYDWRLNDRYADLGD